MRTKPRCWLFAGLLSLASVAGAQGDVTQARILAEAAQGDNWFLKGGNFRGEHFSPLRQINENTVDALGLAWSANLPIPDGISATPIVVDGVIYLSGAYSVVFAIDAGTGRQLWTYDPDVRAGLAKDPGMSWPARVNRGVAVWAGRVYATTADCRLIALDAATGRHEWTRQTCDIMQGYAITDSPYVGGNKVFVGNAGSESGEKNRGYVSAYDAKTGERLWRFYTVPSDDPAENTTPAMKMAATTWSGDALARFGGGGSNWNGMTYDPASNLLFFGTAGALPYVHSYRSPDGGDNLFTSSVLAVNADTGEYVWHYQTVPEDSWEYNATMNIVLADLRVDGEDRETLLIAPKNGFQYVLDRQTGELLAADKFARVNWATHINLETGRPVLDPAAQFWRPDAAETVQVWPNMWGAHSWQPMAWHDQLGLLYIPVIDVPSIVTDFDPESGEYNDTLEIVEEVDGQPFSAGKLIAWDPVRQAARWQVEYPLPFNGGLLATAGNLVFQGDAAGNFNAYAADDGTRLWTVATGSPITAAPVSYRSDDVQFVLVPIGASGGIQFVYPQLGIGDDARGPTRLLAFNLESDEDLPEAVTAAPPLPDQPELNASPDDIAAGYELYKNYYCAGCHGKDAVARRGGTVPDLRYANMDTHESWYDIVAGGERRDRGMPPFEIPEEHAESIRAYILSLSHKLRDDGRRSGN